MSSSAAPVVLEDVTRRGLFPSISCALIALPFLLPIAAAPSVSAWQQLASWFCLLALLLVSREDSRFQLHPTLIFWIASTAALVVIFRSPYLGFTLWLSTISALFAIAIAAGAGNIRPGNNGLTREAFAYGLLWAGVISAVIGLLQYYELAKFLWPLTTQPAAGQAFGNLRQRNQFASLMSMALIAALWLYSRHSSASPRRYRFCWSAVILLLLTAAAASTSRTGLVELVAIVGTAAFLAKKERQWSRSNAAPFSLPAPLVLLSWLPLYFGLAWLLPHLASTGVDSMVQRLSEGAPVGHSRLILWSNVLALIGERPWTGWGWGELSFAHYMHSGIYARARFVEILDNAHNLPLHLAAELGIPAAALICGGFVWLVIGARPWRERDPFRLMAWGVLGVIVLHSLLEYPLWYGPFQLVFGLCLGILWAAPDRPATEFRHWTRPLLAAIVLTSTLLIGYAGWDYLRISQIYLPRDERLPAYVDDTLAKSKRSWLFANQVRFAELSLTMVDRNNAAEVHALARQQLHFSPEPRVIIKLIESARLLGLDNEAKAEAKRMSIAYPAEYAAWISEGLDFSRPAADSRQP
ncbi:PglL family O-oligosaccharyltransferase [Variovorax sp. tm]|uniref:PglL family O-oligosaccharyltransferase n=1 Tax=Variovorax atrisoli TaxID=3394203 RepID=UPI003A800028